MRKAHGQQAIERGRCCIKNENALFTEIRLRQGGAPIDGLATFPS
jgi:hypothetical protein